MATAFVSANSEYSDQQKKLEEALNVVNKQATLMKRCLETNKLMDGLKHGSAMLSELRSSVLSPKHYYELYMAIFDHLRHLTTYLAEAHAQGWHDLFDLYELVQYAGNIVPRLYLMITVGSVYMGVPEAPVKEIMKDMMEMTRGVQHPTRGLFLRHYLSGMTKDHLPVGNSDGPQGNLDDSIDFTLSNFVEMNKLWVRLQHQGRSRDREKRVAERKELRTLVGSNLVRLSQLEGINLDIYVNRILPDLLEQITNCKDLIAQEYLMEAIIQVFQDDFHLRTLTPFLASIANLHPKLSTKGIVISFIDRLSAYASREAENESEIDLVNSSEASLTSDQQSVSNENESTSASTRLTRVRTHRGIPEDVKLFEILWKEVQDLIEARQEMAFEETTALLLSSANLALSCYPEELEYIDQVLSYAEKKYNRFTEGPDVRSATATANLLGLLQAPIEQYSYPLTLLKLNNYNSLFKLQPYETRRTIAHRFIATMLKKETLLQQPSHIDGVFEILSVLTCDQPDGGIQFTGKFMDVATKLKREKDDHYSTELTSVAKLLHRVQNLNPAEMFELLQSAFKIVAKGDIRILYTLPPIITATLKLCHEYALIPERDEDVQTTCKSILRFLMRIIATLYEKAQVHNAAFRYFLSAVLAADELDLRGQAYDFFVEAFLLYEECIGESKEQMEAILLMIGTLHTSRGFDDASYDALATKCVLHAGKLLKKPDQARAICHAARLFWVVPVPSFKSQPAVTGDNPLILLTQRTEPLYRDGARALDNLQRALKIADGVMDPLANFELFVDILNHCIYFFTMDCETIHARFINGLLELIKTQFESLGTDSDFEVSNGVPNLSGPPRTRASVVDTFHRTLAHIRELKSQPPFDSFRTDYDQLVVDNVDF